MSRANSWGGTRATRIRRHLAATLPAPFWRCGDTIQPGDDWHVGHLVGIADGGRLFHLANVAPEHGSACNLRASADRTNQQRNRNRPWW